MEFEKPEFDFNKSVETTAMSRGNFNSKWDYIKSISRWHFNPWRKETEAFKVFLNIRGDWQKELDELNYEIKVGISNYVHNGKTGDDLIEKDFLSWGYKKSMTQYDRTYQIPDKLMNIAEQLHLKHPDVRIHKENPGEVSPIHADMYCSHPAVAKDPSLDLSKMQRFVIQLTDWDWGHFWSFGNTPWVQWRAGDVASFHSRDIIHCAANAGRKPRITMIVTGWMTDKTKELIAGGPTTINI